MTTKSMNGTAHERRVEKAVSDLDLMLYHDGELSTERHEQVRRAITRDEVLRNKLGALEVSSAIVRERAVDAAANIDFADAVMAKIMANDVAVSLDERDAALGAAPGEGQPRETSTTDTQTVRLEKLEARAKASNDNARGIFALAALAVAAAASLMIWGRLAPNPSVAPAEPIAMVTTQEVAPVAPPVEMPLAPAGEADVAEDQGMGVEVAAVDFGSRVGTIFYVETEAATSRHTTTVVWLTDSDGEEK